MNDNIHNAPYLSSELTLESLLQTIRQLDKGFVQCIQFCFNPMKQIKGNNNRKSDITDKWQDLIHFCSPLFWYGEKQAHPFSGHVLQR